MRLRLVAPCLALAVVCAGDSAAPPPRAALSSLSGYRSGASAYVDMSGLSNVTWSQATESKVTASATRESAASTSADRPSAYRASEVRASDPRWSATSESRDATAKVTWSDARGSLSTLSDLTGEASGMAQAVASASRAAPVPTPVDLSHFSPDVLAPGDLLPSLPPIYQTVSFANKTYYTYDDVFYQPATVDGIEGYLVVPPPVGASVRRLPPGAERRMVGNQVRFVAGEVHFIETTSGYLVVSP